LSKEDAVEAELRMYDRLFLVEKPIQPSDNPEVKKSEINPKSLIVCPRAFVHKSVAASMNITIPFQFERLGYFFPDKKDSKKEINKLVFNRTAMSQAQTHLTN